MILVGPHAEAVARVVGEFVPLAEAVFPMLRKPLSERLTSNLASIDASVKPDARATLRMYGVQVDPSLSGPLAGIEGWAQAALAGRVRGLIAALDRDAKMSIAGFIGDLMQDMVAAIETHGRYKAQGAPTLITAPHAYAGPAAPADVDAAATALELPARDLEVIFRGDAAFRTLVAFLDHARHVLRTVQPRSIIAARST